VVDQRDITALGESLRRISQKFMKTGQSSGSTRVWYQGGEPYFDIFLDVKNEEIQWFQVTLRGKSLSWSRQSAKVQTGTTSDLDQSDQSYFAASKTIRGDTQIDTEFLNLVTAVLQTRPDEPFLEQMLKVLS
jgi:hypothetical protein